MSSVPPGRYQSRLFNFLNRQSQRLTNQYDRTVRQLKVAAVWGAQIMLYPIYLIVQGGLAAGRQLSQSAEAGWPQIKALTNSQPQPEVPPSADTPIERVLDEIISLSLPQFQGQAIARLSTGTGSKLTIVSSQSLILNQASDFEVVGESKLTIVSSQSLIPNQASDSEVVTASQEHLSTKAQESSLIQGIATLLETRTLVLVTSANQILDILTPQQQQKLASKISWELADLRRQWRLAETSSGKFKAQFRLSALKDKPRVFAPVRMFWHLMAWVQTSPVAIAANLFQESNLLVGTASHYTKINYTITRLHSQQPALNGQETLPQLAPQPALAFLDRTMAELESHQLVPGSEVVISLTERTTRSLKAHTQKFRQQIQTSLRKLNNQTESPEEPQTNTFRIQSLIYAAVDYFFGKHNSNNLPGTDFSEQPSIPGNHQSRLHQLSGQQSTSLPSAKQLSNLRFADDTEPDPWLSWDDLYGSPQTPEQAKNSTPLIRGKKNSRKQLPESFNSKMPVKLGNSILSVIKRYLGFQTTPGKLSAPNTTEPKIESAPIVVQTPATLKTRPRQKSSVPTKRKTSSPNVVNSRRTKALPTTKANSAITTPNSPSTKSHLEAKPDWIETQATPSGYVKHPLEQVLGWLDSLMLWLEELVVKMWRWVRGR